MTPKYKLPDPDCPVCGGSHPDEGRDCRAYYPRRQPDTGLTALESGAYYVKLNDLLDAKEAIIADVVRMLEGWLELSITDGDLVQMAEQFIVAHKKKP